MFLEFTHARGCGRADDDLHVGDPGLDRLDELGADVDLPDADSMQPDDVPVRQRLLDLGIKAAKPMAEILLPSPAPPHFKEVKWGTQAEENRE